MDYVIFGALVALAYRTTIYICKAIPPSKVTDTVLVILIGPHPTTPK